MHAAALDRYFAGERPRHVDELKAVLRIPSVSALPAHRANGARAADWVAEQLWAALPDLPTVLIDGHYDTRPTALLDEWELSLSSSAW